MMQQKTVLIIDDCLEDRQTYRRYLLKDEQYCYTILEAESGEEGLALYQSSRPDVILLDFRLPDIDGLEFLDELAAQSNQIHPPVLMLTGHGNESIAVQAMKSGASDYLIKGRITAEELRLAVRSALKNADLRQQLQRSEAKYRQIVETANEGIWMIDADAKTSYVNQQMAQMLGYSIAQMLGRSMFDFMDEAARTEATVNLERRKQGIEEQHDFRFCRKDGTDLWTRISSNPIFDNKGQFLGALAMITDISDVYDELGLRQRVENELRQEREELKRQIQRSQLLLDITTKVRQSLQIEEILQTTVTEVQQLLQVDRVLIFRMEPDSAGKVVQEAVLPGWPVIFGQTIFDPCFHKDYIEKYRQGMISAIVDLEQAQIQRCHVKLLQQFAVKANLVVPILTQDCLWGLMIAHQCSGPRQWTTVEIELLLQLANQVGIAIAQAQLLQAFQESEEKFRQLAENIQEVFFIYPPDYSQILYISPAYEQIWGRSIQSLYQEPNSWLLQIHPEDRDRVETALQKQAAGAEFCEEYRIIRPDGELRWIYGRTFRAYNRAKRIYRLVGIAVDITERKLVEEATREAQNKEILLKEIHHRVKNNLQIVSGLLYLQSRQVEDERMLQMLQDSRDRLQSMALIHEQLYGSKNLDSIDFREYIQTLTKSLFSSYASNTNAITLTVNIEPIFLDIDTAIPCGLIVNELVSNALKHAFPLGNIGEITVELSLSEDNTCTLTVRDTGIGISENIDLVTQKSLGLRLVRSLATKQLKGTVEIERTMGTTFTIIFNKN